MTNEQSQPTPGVYRWDANGKLINAVLPWSIDDPVSGGTLAEFLAFHGYTFDERVGPPDSFHIEVWDLLHPHERITGDEPAPDFIAVMNSRRGFRLVLCHGPQELALTMNLYLGPIASAHQEEALLAAQNARRCEPRPRNQRFPFSQPRGDDFADLVGLAERQPATA